MQVVYSSIPDMITSHVRPVLNICMLDLLKFHLDKDFSVQIGIYAFVTFYPIHQSFPTL